MWQIVSGFCLIIAAVHCAEFPTYIKKCKISDPKLNDCLTEQSNKMLSNIVDGDKSLRISTSNPARIQDIVFKPNKNFEFKFTNCSGHGLNNYKVLHLRMDPKFQIIDLDAYVHNYILMCDYKAKGELVKKVFDDNGSVNVSFVDCAVTYSTNFDLQEINGTSYYSVDNDIFHVKDCIIDFNLSHLDKSDDTQAQELNQLLQEKPNYFIRQFTAPLDHTASVYVTSLIRTVFALFPADQLFEKEL